MDKPINVYPGISGVGIPQSPPDVIRQQVTWRGERGVIHMHDTSLLRAGAEEIGFVLGESIEQYEKKSRYIRSILSARARINRDYFIDRVKPGQGATYKKRRSKEDEAKESS